MTVRAGQSLRAPGPLLGPFASGAPAIFIDQVARLGHPCGIVSCVGEDEFGRLNVERLQDDGVDVSAVQVLSDEVTGTAFVTYDAEGGRSFVYNIARSASAHIALHPAAERLLSRCAHLHLTGSSLFSDSMAEVLTAAAQLVKARGGSVSLDPNVRVELLTTPARRAALRRLVSECDLLLPSESELMALTDASDESGAARELLRLGITAIVVKRGDQGATYVDGARRVHSPAFAVHQVDPTGAGDRFDAGYVVSWLRGETIEESLRVANACGAAAVATQGPMEGMPAPADLDQWLSA